VGKAARSCDRLVRPTAASYEIDGAGGNLWTAAITGIVASGTAQLLYTQGTAAMA